MARAMAPPMTQRRKSIRRHLLIYAAITPYVVIAVFPIYWMAITAFKQDPDLYRMEHFPFWFNLAPTLRNFKILFYQTHYGDWIWNTFTISALVALITLVTAVPAGYALARLKLPGAENSGIAIFLTYLVPPIILFLPLSRIVAELGLQDSWWALVVVYPTFTIPFCTWLLMGFFKTVPMEIEEAARVDGCGQAGAFLRVILPISLPGVLTSVIFAFTLSMQDFLYGLAFVSPGDQKPVPVGVPTELIRGDVYYWGSLMGAALLVGLPVAILYNFFLDRFIQGITGGIGKCAPREFERRLCRHNRFLGGGRASASRRLAPPVGRGAKPPSEDLFGVRADDGIGSAGVADVEDEVLHGLVGPVEGVVPPAAVVHVGLAGRVILRARDADRPRLVLGGEDTLDDVDEGGHAELQPPRVATWLQLDRLAGEQDRRVDGGAEASERGDEVSRLDALRRLRVRRRLLGVRGREEGEDERHHETEREPDDHGSTP